MSDRPGTTEEKIDIWAGIQMPGVEIVVKCRKRLFA